MSRTRSATRAVKGAWPVERFVTPKQCASYRVRDPVGRRIGRLKRSFSYENGGGEYAEIGVGLFGMKTVLIAVQSVTAEGGNVVFQQTTLAPDGTAAAAFDVWGLTAEGILRAAGQDAQAANRVGRETLSARNGRRP